MLTLASRCVYTTKLLTDAKTKIEDSKVDEGFRGIIRNAAQLDIINPVLKVSVLVYGKLFEIAPVANHWRSRKSFL